jgi:hypothetical protein
MLKRVIPKPEERAYRSDRPFSAGRPSAVGELAAADGSVFVDVVAGLITLRAPFSAVLVCNGLPHGTWDGARRLWTFPATASNARLIQSLIPRLEATDKFSGLLSATQVVQSIPPTPRPEPHRKESAVILPAGLKTKPWRHQMEAFQFAMKCLKGNSPWSA